MPRRGRTEIVADHLKGRDASGLGSKGGHTPSVCDWVLVWGITLVMLVDATNHWLDEKAAQGFADPEDYQADLGGHVRQQKIPSSCSPRRTCSSTTAGKDAHSTKTLCFGANSRRPQCRHPGQLCPPMSTSSCGLGQLGTNVRSPGILVYDELQVFEGVCEHQLLKRGSSSLLAAVADHVHRIDAGAPANVSST